MASSHQQETPLRCKFVYGGSIPLPASITFSKLYCRQRPPVYVMENAP
jgi:hypothetical protein